MQGVWFGSGFPNHSELFLRTEGSSLLSQFFPPQILNNQTKVVAHIYGSIIECRELKICLSFMAPFYQKWVPNITCRTIRPCSADPVTVIKSFSSFLHANSQDIV